LVRVCSNERLLIECLDKPHLVGGWEQTLKSLETLGGVEYQRIPELLEILGNQKQARVTGFILELLRQHSIYHHHLPDDTLKTLEGMVEGQPTYLVEGVPGPLDKRWRLYIPEYFTGLLRGV
jgi:predicted transcriptional regulator of viral defense system